MHASIQLVCPTCLARNQVPVTRMRQRPICEVCRSGLISDIPTDLTPQTFQRFVAQNDLPVLVEFWSPVTGSCLGMPGESSAAAHELRGRVLLARVNTLTHPALARRKGVETTPLFVLYLEGRELARHATALAPQDLRAWLAGA